MDTFPIRTEFNPQFEYTDEELAERNREFHSQRKQQQEDRRKAEIARLASDQRRDQRR